MLRLRPSLILHVQVEVEIHQLFAADGFASAVAEAEFFEQLDRRLALHKRVERDLQVAMLVAEFQRGFDELGADAAAADIAAHAQAANLADALLVMLQADHANDLSLWANRAGHAFGHPEM